MNSIVFPPHESSYGVSDFKEVIWIPRKLSQIKSIQEGAKNSDKLKKQLLKDAIPCLYIPFENSKYCLIYSHGNACDIGEMYPSFVNYAQTWQVNVIAYEYPGYGIAKGSASPSTIKKDIKIVYNFAINILKAEPQNIIFFGRSIGTGPSTYMASRISQKIASAPAALILQSPYTSIRDIAKEIVGPIGVLAPKMFNNYGNISQVQCPILIIHGEKDDIILINHSDVLVKNVPHTKMRYNKLPFADHNDFDEQVDIILPVREFLGEYFNTQGGISTIPEWLYQNTSKRNSDEKKTKIGR